MIGDEEIGPRIGARIRELRLERELSVRELGRRAGLHRPNVFRVERGETEPKLSTIARCAAALEVSLAEILSALEEPCDQCKGPGEPDHTCPYDEEINKCASACNCCASCEDGCRGCI